MRTFFPNIKRAVIATRQSRRFFALSLIALLLCLPLAEGAQAAAGDLDPTFGTGGKVVTGFDSYAAQSVAIQSDGKIIAAGFSFPSSSSIRRYNTDGSPDPTFGLNGNIFVPNVAILDIALQKDGKIVAVGGGFAGLLLARYNSDGSLDSSFGSGGFASINISSPLISARANAVVIQDDGKIVMAGESSSVFFLSHFFVARYDSNGSLDTSFGTGGLTVMSFFNQTDGAFAVGIQKDGKIIAAGETSVRSTFPPFTHFALARYNSDGSLDSTFGVGGKVTTSFFNNFNAIKEIAIQNDGKIVAAGHTFVDGVTFFDFALARYDASGNLDPSFGSGGKVTTDLLHQDDMVRSLVIQSDGKIIASGLATHPNFRQDFGLARYNTNGSLDATFGNGGKVNTDFSDQQNEIFDSALQSDGKLVVVGRTVPLLSPNMGTNSFALARYNTDSVSFDTCLQDDNNGNLLLFSSITGDYLLTNCHGTSVGGKGVVSRSGCVIALQHVAADRRVVARFDTCSKKASASVQVFSLGATFSIRDSNTTNNACSCQ